MNHDKNNNNYIYNWNCCNHGEVHVNNEREECDDLKNGCIIFLYLGFCLVKSSSVAKSERCMDPSVSE